MAITWGPVQSAQGASVQLGLDFSTATQATSQTVVAIVYLRCTAGYVSDNYNTLVFYGDVSKSISNVNGTISAGQSHELGRATFTVPRLQGRANAYAVGARLDGYTVGTPSVTKNGSVPSAGYNSPARPLLYVTRQSDSRVQITWDTTPDPGAPVHGFNLEQREDGGTWRRIMNTADGTLRGWTDTSVSRGHVYDYRVRAVGPGGESEWNTYNGLYMTPFAPASVVAARDGQDVVVTWANRGVGDYTTHVWQGDTTAGAANLSGPLDPGVTSFRVTGLDVTKEYVFTVGHITPDGLTATTVSNTVRLLAAPLAPTNLTPDGGYQPIYANVRFSWSHNPTDGTAQSKYEFRYRTSQGGAWNTVTGTTSNQYYSRSLPSGSIFEWQVRTWGQDITKPSEWSSIAAVTPATRPTASFISPAAQTTITSDRATIEFSSSRYPASYTLKVESGDETREYQGYGSGQFTRTLTGLPNNSDVMLWLKVHNKVESGPVTRALKVKYAAPAEPTGSANWVGDTGVVGVHGVSRDGQVTTDHVNVYRQQADGTLVLLGTLPAYSYDTVPDPVAPLTGATYVVEAVAPSGSTTRVAVAVGPAPVQATYLNWGAGVAKWVRFRHNPTTTVSTGRGVVEQEFAGHALPRVVFTDRVSRQVDIGGTLAGFYAGDTDSTPDEQARMLLDDLAMTDTPVVVRLVTGETFTGYVTGVKASRALWGGWQASLTFVEAEHA